MLPQKQTYGSTEHNREPRKKKKKHKPIINYSLTKDAGIYNGEKTVSSARGVVKVGQPHVNQ